MIVKNLNFGDTAREQVFKAITKLTQAVSSTLGASGKCVLLEDATGKPIITKDAYLSLELRFAKVLFSWFWTLRLYSCFRILRLALLETIC